MGNTYTKCKKTFSTLGEPMGNLEVLKIAFATEAVSHQSPAGMYALACAGLSARYRDYSHEEMVQELRKLGNYDELLDAYLKDSLETVENTLGLLQ